MKFNVRVYGLLENDGMYLVLEEIYKSQRLIKFPGGGVEFKEGLIDCLKREFKEELNLELKQCDLLYVHEPFLVSKFSEEEQLILLYYKVISKELNDLKLAPQIQKIHWVKRNNLTNFLHLPADLEFVKRIKQF